MKKPVFTLFAALSLVISAGGYLIAHATVSGTSSGELGESDRDAMPDLVRLRRSGTHDRNNATIRVNCAAGDHTALGRAIEVATDGTTIQLTGLCNEAVIITKDGLTLDGQNQALTIIDGGGITPITIDGAHRVTIKNMVVQNGEHGINVIRGAGAYYHTAKSPGRYCGSQERKCEYQPLRRARQRG